jgi:hypothetical protein
MARLRLVCAGFIDIDAYFESFEVREYRFESAKPRPVDWPDDLGIAPGCGGDTRSVTHTALVDFVGRQEDSILYKGGIVGSTHRVRKRKLIEDVLLLASLLTGHNWWLYSRKVYHDFPVVNANHLKCVAPGQGGEAAGRLIELALQSVVCETWQTQFEGGLHLRMLLNHSNILATEARFLSLMVIWEWLFAHIRNPGGATVNDESKNLNEVLVGVLEEYFPGKVNGALLYDKCIFYVLRNQLAHCGRLPIDRDKAETWMRKLHCDFQPLSLKGVGVIDYIVFFQLLTQTIVLRTLGLDVSGTLDVFSFSENLDSFLKTGKIRHRCW